MIITLVCGFVLDFSPVSFEILYFVLNKCFSVENIPSINTMQSRPSSVLIMTMPYKWNNQVIHMGKVYKSIFRSENY